MEYDGHFDGDIYVSELYGQHLLFAQICGDAAYRHW
jgi:hypothetical protein